MSNDHLPFMLVNIVPQRLQRYETQGDFFERNGVMHFVITRDNFIEELKTLLHEIAEWGLNEIDGISIKEVDNWDMGAGKESDDPGNMLGCPYQHNHITALKIENIIDEELVQKGK